jgi:hypothetical protein
MAPGNWVDVMLSSAHIAKLKKRTVFGPHPDQNCQVEITVFCNTPECGLNHVWHGFPSICGYLLRQKADSFGSAVQREIILPFKQIQSEVSEEIGFDDPAPSHFFRSSPDEKSGQFLVRTHVRKNAQIPRISGGMSGVLKLARFARQL